MMNNKEFAEKLLNIAHRPNAYCNIYPRNLCYYDGSKITADCWNLIKSLIWDNNIDNNYTEGKFARPDFSTGLGDWNADQIIAHCNYISNDFSQIPVGAFLYYYDGSHAGAYVGDGKVVEATIGWNQNGIIVSKLGLDGERMYKNIQSGYWSKWAKLPWIEYIEEKVEEPVEVPIEEPVVEAPIEEKKEQSVWAKILIEIFELIKNIFMGKDK